MASDEKKFKPEEWVPSVMAIGTWLFAMYQEAHGMHYVPDKWIVTIILAPYGARVYLLGKTKLGDVLKRLPGPKPGD